MRFRALILLPVLAWPLVPASGQGPLLGAQVTVIGQHLFPFSALYSGPKSLDTTSDTKATHTYGVYLGARVLAHLQAYLDVEMAQGAGISNATGLAGITNGDVIRQGTANLSRGPYLARIIIRYVVPLGTAGDTLVRGIDQLPGVEPSARLEVKAGKLAASDDFDQNRYANSTRLQFCDWGLFNNSAWDYAADTRGYSYGVLVAWVHPRWTLKLGRYLMPTFANGNTLDWDIRRAHGDNVELALTPAGGAAPVIRLLAYENHANMGSYAEAVTRAQGTGRPPDIVADDQPGRRKYGFGLNVEQPLADSGETGAFLRAGWNDGRTEDFAFTEVDRHVSAGLQVSGTRWRRAADRFALAVVAHGISADHQAYLGAGGTGFLLGDGRLSYGQEQILEGYYWWQVRRHAALSLGGQVIEHPGYNRDRGPAFVGTLRFNLRY